MRCNKYKEESRLLRIFVWNCQTLNIQQKTIRKKKIMHILKIVNNYFPECVYIIDAARVYNIGGNYDSYFDGRNILFIRRDIKTEVVIGNDENWIEIPNLRLGFIYIPPNNFDYKRVTEKLLSWQVRKFNYFGDFNLRTNVDLERWIHWLGGETTLQTGVAGIVKIAKVKVIAAPSDHNALLVYVQRNVIGSTPLESVRIQNKFIKVIQGYLNGNFDFSKMALASYKIVKSRFSNTEEETVMYRILKNFYKGRSEDLYNKFAWRWRSSKKEPFLGKKIPEIVLTSFCKEMNHNPNKFYKIIDETNLPSTFTSAQLNEIIKKRKDGSISKIDFKSLSGLRNSYSVALTMENIELRKINKVMKNYIRDKLTQNDIPSVQNMIKNIVKSYNELLNAGHHPYNLTFFLRKNNILESYKDVRMITITPALMKMYEALIYDKVVHDICELIKKDKYQFGAFPGSSTYNYMYYLRYKIDRYQAVGLVNVDITKGYERLIFANLMKAIDMLESVVTKRLLKVWTFMVSNLDYMINGKIVRSTKGIPMGLALSPVVFVLYLHKALENIDKEYLVSYMDDISILMLRDGMNDDYVKSVLSALMNFGLDVNPRKSVIFTDGENFDEKRLKYFEITKKNYLPVVSVSKILGRELSWAGEVLTGDNCNFVIENKIPKIIPNWLTLAMRRIIYIGGLTAKERYIGYMWSFGRKDIRVRILKNAFNFFYMNFNKLNYVQLFLILPNLFREFIDPYKLLQFSKSFKDLLLELGLEEKDFKPGEEYSFLCLKDLKDKEIIIKKNLTIYMDPLTLDMEQFDLLGDFYGYDEDFIDYYLYSLYKLDDSLDLIWINATKTLNMLWYKFLAVKLKSWNRKAMAEDRPYYVNILATDYMQDYFYRTFKSLRKFAILLDMLFGRLEFLNGQNFWIFLFDILEKIANKVGMKEEKDLFTVKKMLFTTIGPDKAEDRYDMMRDLLKLMAETEHTIFKDPLAKFKPYTSKNNPNVEAIKRYNDWHNAYDFMKYYRKILFVVDSMYAAKKEYVGQSMAEIMYAFQIKYFFCHDSYSELEKVLLIQDWEEVELDQNLDKEDISFEENPSEYDMDMDLSVNYDEFN